tara:strand:- start:4928 stop:5893 length:966 start_codon:yes stop_codon:yes gene_type:complete
MMQSAWVGDNVYIHKTACRTNFSFKLSFYNIFWIILGLKEEDALIYHAQSSLPYLVFSKIFCFFLIKKNIFVYDVHDLHEDSNDESLYVKLRYLIFLWLEFFIFKIRSIRKMTVSRGLSCVISSKYRVEEPVVVYNCSVECADYINALNDRSESILFFGTKERFPIALLDVIQDSDMTLSFYGRGVNYEWLSEINKCYDRSLVNIYGEYSPDNLNFVSEYKVALNFFPENNSLNFKYSLPNKLFQAIGMGTTVIVSENFHEMIDLFSEIKYAVVSATEDSFTDVVSDIVKNRTMEDAWSGVLKLRDIKNESMDNYKKLVAR